MRSNHFLATFPCLFVQHICLSMRVGPFACGPMAASSPGPDPATTASLELLRPLLAALSSLRGIVQALNRF
jgi:hypothetical protein